MKGLDLQKLLERKMTRKEFFGVCAIALASVVGITAVLRALQLQADTATTASFQPEAGTKSGVTTVVDSGASGGSAVQFGQVVTTPPGAITHGRQLNATNTGPEAAGYTSLKTWTGSTSITTNGTVIEGYRFVNGAPSVYADNVVLRGCEFRSTGPQWWIVRNEGKNLIVEDCRFRPDATNGPETTMAQSYQQGIKCFGVARGLTVRRCEFWGFGNAIEFEPTNSTSTTPIIVEDTWMHHAAAITYSGSDEYHHDGILSSYASNNVRVRRCKIVSLGNTNALAFQSTGGKWSDCIVTDSYFSGFGWTVNFGDSYGSTRFVFTGNEFSTELKSDYGPGPANPWDDATSTWSNNKWIVPAGAQWGNAAWNGQYWWPGDGKTGGHASDY